MLEKYRKNFESLSPQETTMVTRSLVARRPEILDHGTEAPTSLYDICDRAGLGQGEVVLALAPDPSPEAVVVLEKLVGKPITRGLPAPSLGMRVGDCPPDARKKPERKAAGPRGAALKRDDNRVISYVAPNPKKQGSSSYTRYELYAVGQTISQFIAAGGTMADVRWDLDRGFIKTEGGE